MEDRSKKRITTKDLTVDTVYKRRLPLSGAERIEREESFLESLSPAAYSAMFPQNKAPSQGSGSSPGSGNRSPMSGAPGPSGGSQRQPTPPASSETPAPSIPRQARKVESADIPEGTQAPGEGVGVIPSLIPEGGKSDDVAREAEGFTPEPAKVPDVTAEPQSKAKSSRTRGFSLTPTEGVQDSNLAPQVDLYDKETIFGSTPTIESQQQTAVPSATDQPATPQSAPPPMPDDPEKSKDEREFQANDTVLDQKSGISFMDQRNKVGADLRGVDPRLKHMTAEGIRVFENMHQGRYKVEILGPSGGMRSATTSYHGSGGALDLVIVDTRTGRRLTNFPGYDKRYGYQGSAGENAHIYQDLMNRAKIAAHKFYPDVSGSVRWGGYGKWQGNEFDTMHIDLDPQGRGMGGGTFEKGFSREFMEKYGVRSNQPITDIEDAVKQQYAPGGPKRQDAPTAPAAGPSDKEKLYDLYRKETGRNPYNTGLMRNTVETDDFKKWSENKSVTAVPQSEKSETGFKSFATFDDKELERKYSKDAEQRESYPNPPSMVVLHDVSAPKGGKPTVGAAKGAYHMAFDENGFYLNSRLDKQAPHAADFNELSLGLAHVGMEGDKLSPKAIKHGAHALAYMMKFHPQITLDSLRTHAELNADPRKGIVGTRMGGKNPKEGSWRESVLDYLQKNPHIMKMSLEELEGRQKKMEYGGELRLPNQFSMEDDESDMLNTYQESFDSDNYTENILNKTEYETNYARTPPQRDDAIHDLANDATSTRDMTDCAAFNRFVARSRFEQTGDPIIGGHFDYGASNFN